MSNVLAIGTGNDLANTITMAGVGMGTLAGRGGNDTVNGNTNNDTLTGDEGNDKLTGGAGNDTLDGGADIDVMTGGKGDDLYFVDNLKDTVTEAAKQGADIVVSTLANYTLSANVETLFLDVGAGNGTGNTLTNLIIGNLTANTLDGGGGNDELKGLDGNDLLIGGAGNDTLNGGADADTMKGGAGNDFYIVDDAGDKVSEVGGSGIDKVESSVSFILDAGVENLVLAGVASTNGTGNSLANTMLGNSGKNELVGDAGNDTLDGGGENDTLKGGAGNDTYFVDSLFDVVVEKAGEGKDTVISSVGRTMDAGDRDPDPVVEHHRHWNRQRSRQHHHHGWRRRGHARRTWRQRYPERQHQQ